MTHALSLAVMCGYFVIPAFPAFAADVFPAFCDIADDGLKVSESFSASLEAGDVITHADGVKITATNAVGLTKRLAKSAKAITLTIRRGEQTLKQRVALIPDHELIAMQRKRKEELEQAEKARKQQALQRWLASTKFKDTRGREWSIDEINAFNSPLETDVIRAVRKHRDAQQDERARMSFDGSIRPSIGSYIDSGLGALRTAEEILQLSDGEWIQSADGSQRWNKLEQWASRINDNNSKSVEILFDFTDYERHLIWCRDGTLMTAEQVWDQAVRSSVGR